MAGLFDLAALDTHKIQRNLFLALQFRQIETKRHHIGGEFFSRFFKHHEDTRLAKLHRATHQKFRRQHGLTATCRAADQGWPPGRQAPTSNLIEPKNASRNFGKLAASLAA